jgi:hypothetical protein
MHVSLEALGATTHAASFLQQQAGTVAGSPAMTGNNLVALSGRLCGHLLLYENRSGISVVVSVTPESSPITPGHLSKHTNRLSLELPFHRSTKSKKAR